MTFGHFLHDLWAVLWGATWGNNTAAVEWASIIGITGWLGRNKITKRLAALWALHHAPHAIAQHKQALREHEAEKRQREEGSA